VKNVKIIWIDRNGLLSSNLISSNLIWSRSSLTLSQQRYKGALPTKIHRTQQKYIGTKGCGSNTGTSYIQSNVVLTKIERNVDGTRYLHIFSMLSQQIYKDNNIVDRTHNPLPTNKHIETTTLWIEHMTLFQQRYKGSNIVHRTHDLHIFNVTYGQISSYNTSWNNWAHLETIGTDYYFEIRLEHLGKRLWINC